MSEESAEFSEMAGRESVKPIKSARHRYTGRIRVANIEDILQV